MKLNNYQSGGIDLTNMVFTYLLVTVIVLFASHKYGGWLTVLFNLILLIVIPIAIILLAISHLYLALLFSNRKYGSEIARMLIEYPQGKVIQISNGKWKIISESTGETLAKVFLDAAGKIKKVNLKSD